MSAQQGSAASEATAKKAGATTDDNSVREYLKQHNDFFQRHPDMLDYLHINHASGSAVSLVEKQVSVLRERNIDMRRRLSGLTANARDNDKLYEQTRMLILKLLEAESISALCHSYMEAMNSLFEVEYASIILFGEQPENDVDYRVESRDRADQSIGALLNGDKAVCGALRKEELNYLFPDAGEIGSAALMPLRSEGELGLIAVGSSDAGRYTSNMGTLFLHHIADVIVRLLPRLDKVS